MAAVTLFEALENIPDHRTKKGRRYPLTAIVAISLAAMLSGAKDLRAIFFRGRQLTPTACKAWRQQDAQEGPVSQMLSLCLPKHGGRRAGVGSRTALEDR